MAGTVITANTFVPPTNPNQQFVVDNPAASLFVVNGATISSPTAIDGGIIFDEVGGTVNNALIGLGGGELRVFGGTANATEIASGGKVSLFGNAGSVSTATNTRVDAGGILDVGVNGSTASSSNNTVLGLEIVSVTNQGGTDTGSTVTGQSSFMLVNPAGVATRETVTNGGAISVSAGATLSGAVVTGTNSLVSAFGAGTSGINVSAGGTLIVNPGASVSNDTVGSGGTESVSGTEASATIQGGTLTVQTGGTFQKVTFDDSGSPTTTGTLAIAGTASPTGTISKFGPKDAIDLQGLAYAQGGTATLGANDVLTVTENGRSMTLQLDPAQSYAGDYFALAPDAANGGTNVTMMQASANPKENIALSAAEKHFAGQVSFNISAFDPTPFADMVSLIQNSPQAYFNAVHAEAKDPLLLAALADPSTGAAKRAEIGNAALQLASAIAGLGAGSALQTAAAITAGAIHQIEAGQVGMGFVNNALQNKAGTILVAENHVRPY